MSRPFRERNPVIIGAVSLAVIALMITIAMKAQDMPVIGGGDTYYAAFTDSSGLRPNDVVRVSGVKVGKVRSVGLDGDRVKVTFRITESDVHFGPGTGAAIKVATVLGAKYLALEPRGPGQMKKGTEIPLSRTVAAYDVTEAFQDLAETAGQIDTDQLAVGLNTIADTFKDSPDEVKASLEGLARLSTTIASRDEKLRDLLRHSHQVTGVLSARNTEFVRLIRDSELLLQEVSARRDVIHQLLVSTTEMSRQLVGLIKDNEAQLRPTLQKLDQVVEILQRNSEALEQGIEKLAVFVRVFTNTVGSGRWFDSYVVNLVGTVPGFGDGGIN